MKLNFMQDALVLPGAVLLHSQADAVQLRVLLWLASDLSLAQKNKQKQLAKLADCDVKTACEAIDFWLSKGVLTVDDGEMAESSKTVKTTESKAGTKSESKSASKSGLAETSPTPRLVRRAEELPNYTSVELAELLEKRATVRALVDEAQQLLGKMFNPSEINILVCMYDYLGLSEEGILLLLSHCKRIGKIKLRSIEKYAYQLVERDITTPDALEEEFRTVEAMYSFEGQVRALFGMKARALTSREEKMLRAWVSFGYDIEIVRRAYEMTVTATNEASVPYANSILERWNADGLHTAEEIDRAVAEEKEKRLGKKNPQKSAEPTLGNSFDTDDFFEAALRRSFSEPIEKK